MNFGFLCGVLVAFAAAQDTATVEGVVVNKVTGAGISGATVRLSDTTDRYQGVTDDAGTFRITGVEPGSYTPSVEKSGYFNLDRSQNPVSAGVGPVRLRFELNPPAVLRGRVVGPDGNPAETAVDLGRRETTHTNPDGLFSFENIAPGRYTLLARPAGAEHVSGKEDVRTEVVTTYYPSVVDRTHAESIMVPAGAELSGYEIRLQSVPVYHVRGVVLDSEGKPAAKATVLLQARIDGGNPDKDFYVGGRQKFAIQNGPFALEPAEEEPVVAGEDGVFEFPSVRAGEWAIRAESVPVRDEIRQRDVLSLGSATLSLGHGDPRDLKIQLAASFDLSGIITLSDGTSPPSGVYVAVGVVSDNGHSSGTANGEASNVLRFNNVMPGTNQIQADVVAGNYYVASILLGSTDVTGQSVELTPSSPPLKIVLKPAGTIGGTVQEADTGTVILFPQSFTGIGYSIQSLGKAFGLGGIPPGAYYAIALDRFDPKTMAEASFLRGLMPRSTSVRAEPGSTPSLQLRVNHVPD